MKSNALKCKYLFGQHCDDNMVHISFQSDNGPVNIQISYSDTIRLSDCLKRCMKAIEENDEDNP